MLTVPDMRDKIAFQCAGFGVGYLPVHMVRDEVNSGRLVVKQVLEPKAGAPVFIAWRTADNGKALRWFLKRLEDKITIAEREQVAKINSQIAEIKGDRDRSVAELGQRRTETEQRFDEILGRKIVQVIRSLA